MRKNQQIIQKIRGFQKTFASKLKIDLKFLFKKFQLNKTYFAEAVDFLGVKPRPALLLSLSLNESGVDADKDEREGRVIAIERAERSLTYLI